MKYNLSSNHVNAIFPNLQCALKIWWNSCLDWDLLTLSEETHLNSSKENRSVLEQKKKWVKVLLS